MSRPPQNCALKSSHAKPGVSGKACPAATVARQMAGRTARDILPLNTAQSRLSAVVSGTSTSTPTTGPAINGAGCCPSVVTAPYCGLAICSWLTRTTMAPATTRLVTGSCSVTVTGCSNAS